MTSTPPWTFVFAEAGGESFDVIGKLECPSKGLLSVSPGYSGGPSESRWPRVFRRRSRLMIRKNPTPSAINTPAPATPPTMGMIWASESPCFLPSLPELDSFVVWTSVVAVAVAPAEPVFLGIAVLDRVLEVPVV